METLGTLLIPEWTDLPSLPGSEVQVVAFHADDPALQARAQRLLSPAELERAARFRIDRPREEFVAGRAALRVLLGAATGVRPESVPLQVNAFGKPYVPEVHSSVSHSHGLIYVALSRAAPLGVDVEWIDPALEALELAEANYTAEETAHIATLAEGERPRSFCGFWTRKEAVAKAHGRGLGIPLRAIRLPATGKGTAWIEDGAGADADDAWRGEPMEFHVQELAAPQGFAAALAVRGSALPVRLLPVFSSTYVLPVVM